MSNAADREIVFGKYVESISDEFEARMAPAGGIPGIPPLLDARRLKYAIPDEAFKVQAAFNVCLVHQIPRFEGETYGDGPIVMPQTARRKNEEEAPRGIIVSAGLQALDCLRSNGLDLGHLITFCRLAPWRMPVVQLRGHDFYLVILRTGDITGSEDLREALATGRCHIDYEEDSVQHVLVDQRGKRWNPVVPFISEDY